MLQIMDGRDLLNPFSMKSRCKPTWSTGEKLTSKTPFVTRIGVHWPVTARPY